MNFEYITAALEHARCEIIEDAEPYYGEVPDLPGASRNREHTRREQERPCQRGLTIAPRSRRGGDRKRTGSARHDHPRKKGLDAG